MPSAENSYFCAQNHGNEKKNHRHCRAVESLPALRFVRLQPFFAGHAEGRAADGTDGKAVEKAVQGGQVGALQASGKKDQKDDQKGQTTCRKDASETSKQSVFLLVQTDFLPIQTEKFNFLIRFLAKAEKNQKKVQNFLFL